MKTGNLLSYGSRFFSFPFPKRNFEKIFKKALTNPASPIIIYWSAVARKILFFRETYNLRACWNRQTGTFEGRVLMACGFKSHCSHHILPDCVRVAQMTLTHFVRVRILIRQPKNQHTKCADFYLFTLPFSSLILWINSRRKVGKTTIFSVFSQDFLWKTLWIVCVVILE